jgi:tetratricopeptide (TPR) repeat protein
MPKSNHLLLFVLLAVGPCCVKAQSINIQSGEGLSKAEYAATLAAQVTAFYYNKRYQQGYDAAQKAIAVDSLSYSRNINWDMVGTCRVKVKDYQGAVNDLSHFVVLKHEDPVRMRDAVEYKVQAHIALGQLIKAAQIYEYWDQYYGNNTTGPQQAAVLYKGARNKARFNQLITVALSRSKNKLDSVNLKTPDALNTLDYAELLIIAGRPAKAAEILKNDKANYSRTLTSVKKYLLCVADNITGKTPFAILKKQLSDWIYNNTLVNLWDFTMFDRWVAYSGLPKSKQQELLTFQDLIEDKYQ